MERFGGRAQPLQRPHRPPYSERMPHDDDKSTVGERLTGRRDPQDPDGLLTVDQAEHRPDPLAFGHEETDTLEREKERRARRGT